MIMDGRLKTDYGLSNFNAINYDESASVPMDQNFLNAINFDESASVLIDQNFLNAINLNETSIDQNSMNHPPELPDTGSSKLGAPSSLNHERDPNEDSDFSDVVFEYINQILMEEDIEEKSCMLQESAALQAAEKSFYDALMVKEPPSSTTTNVGDYVSPLVPSVLVNCDSPSPMSSNSNIMYGLVDSPVSILSVSDILGDSQSVKQFQKGVEEASRFLPNDNGILDQKEATDAVVVTAEKKQSRTSIPERLRGKRNPHSKDLVEDGRSYKHSAVYKEPSVRSEMFDEVLLCDGGKAHLSQCEFVRKEAIKGGKSRGKKRGGKRDVVDLRTLLSLCAQSVAANDRRSTNDLLKQIREHASPSGDGMQRLAHYFCAGLEARMTGSGIEIYKALLSKPTSAADILKAYHLYLKCCPFTKLFNFFSNKTIMHNAQNKMKLHIIDFGILYGFQWPCFIQRLSTRPGGPPELRITGIDFPCPGFRPSQRVEETGRRLANYAETFNVPFKFKAIAQKWDTITIEDLELESDEMLVVNCAYRFRNLLDETVVVDSPRNKVINFIRKMNPDIFIQGIVNGSYNAPFFITRFREALHFFSSLFDMFDANMGRETHERMLLEKIVWGREAMNVIACEGGERIERPETYKQWQVRNLRAGFRQLPINQEIMKMAKDRVRSGYHKDFVIDEDGQWMLQGWKGRIMHAISTWVPAS